MSRITERDELKPGLRLSLVRNGTSYPVRVIESLSDGRIRVQYVIRGRTDLRTTCNRHDLYTA